ncbi:pyridoxamine 5'-phosphate oxidase family protein [Rhodobacterales bacterium]|nr:pyridoxamine 5'-phosphate oxidase family protein [Rhodobacterales bacterium]
MADLKKRNQADRPPYARIRQMKRGSYDKETAYRVLDTGLVAHVGFLHEERPMVIPMAYARSGDTLYLHGASTTRLVKEDAAGLPMCLTVTMVDGLVAARAAFHHSMNYRCAIVHGTSRIIEDPDEQTKALAAITDHLMPGRWDECRPMTGKELKATGVLSMSIDQVSTKIRAGAPGDDEEDLELDIWAGVVPITTALGMPISDPHVANGTDFPASVRRAKQKFA